MCRKKFNEKKLKNLAIFFRNEEFLKEFFSLLFFLGILIKFCTTKMPLWVSKDYEMTWGHP
jgi:hypothetical protein